MSRHHTRRSESRKKFFGSPLKLPLAQLNTSGAMVIDIEHHAYSPGSWLRHSCFGGPLTPLSSEGDQDVAFDTSTSTDIIDQGAYSPSSWLRHSCFGGPLTPLSSEDDTFDTTDITNQRAYSPRSRLRRSCFEDPLTPLSSEGDFFDSLFASHISNVSTDQIPLTISGQADDGQLPPALTREETYETFDGPLTPLGSDMEIEEAERGESRSVASHGARQALPTNQEKSDIYIKPQASMFDAAHACGWFPDAPPVPKSEIVVSDFADLRKINQFPPSAWKLGPDGRLVRNYDVTFESPSIMPRTGPLTVTSVVKREVRALMRRREEVMRVLEEEGGAGSDVWLNEDPGKTDADNSDKATEDLIKPEQLGPEATEIYDGVSDYPQEWASHQSTGLCYHLTEEMIIE